MATCRLTSAEAKKLENLVNNFNYARQDIENFLEELKGEWESTLEDKSESYQESQAGQDAQERISILDSWIDEISSGFAPDLSEVS